MRSTAMQRMPTPDPPWNIRRKGRPWGPEAVERLRLAPGKIEMVDGKLFWNNRQRLTLLALLLENVGMDAAVRLGDPRLWREAIDALEDSSS
jgi:hypothetical protein